MRRIKCSCDCLKPATAASCGAFMGQQDKPASWMRLRIVLLDDLIDRNTLKCRVRPPPPKKNVLLVLINLTHGVSRDSISYCCFCFFLVLFKLLCISIYLNHCYRSNRRLCLPLSSVAKLALLGLNGNFPTLISQPRTSLK